jgi:hypothetical protein
VDVGLQLLLGVSPLIAITVIVMIKRKYYNLISILSTSLLLVGIVILSYITFLVTDPIEDVSQKDQDLYLVGKYMLEDHYVDAAALLDSLYNTTPFDDRYTLYQARIRALNGQIKQAAVLYTAALDMFRESGNNSFPMSEYELTTAQTVLLSSGVDDQATSRYLVMNNYNPIDYGLLTDGIVDLEQIEQESDQTLDEIRANIKAEQRMLKENDSRFDSLDTQFNLVLDTNQFYNDYLNGDPIDGAEVKKIVRRFNELAVSDSEMVAEVRLAHMKAIMINESYGDVIDTISTDIAMDELIVLSELYITGLVKQSNYLEHFAGLEDEAYEKVIKQTEKNFEKYYENESRKVRSEVKDKIEVLNHEKEHKSLAEIKSRIVQGMDNTLMEDHSKVYMHLSKIENYMGNDDKSDDAVKNSMNTVSYSSDPQYSEPLQQIIRIINDKESSEAIKQVPQHVTTMMDHSLPIQIHKRDDTESSIEVKSTFEQYLTEYIIKKKAVINIGHIDTTNFPEVRAKVQFGSSSAMNDRILENKLELYDMGMKIEDYTIEKVDFSSSRIMLLTDVSGSMIDAVADLKLAVTQFVANINEKEFISLVGFDDSIKFTYDFTDNQSELNEAVNQLGAFGGTSIVSSLQYGMEQFPNDLDANNVIIVMTDGQDGDGYSNAEIESIVSKMSRDNNITVYTVGLGSEVETVYLEDIARYGNGKFIYAYDSESLKEFYDFIHNQLTSQYVVTYSAQNTFDVHRELMISLPEEQVKASRSYSLLDESSTATNEAVLLVSDIDQVSLSGLNTKLIYKNSLKDYELILHGEGFLSAGHISIMLSGDSDYDISNYRIMDDTQIALTLSSTMNIGSYDLQLTADSKHYQLDKELEIAVPGTSQHIKFGPYSLSARQIINVGNHQYTLKGNVELNNYIKFKGELLIKGDYRKDLSIELVDNYGSYIAYDQSNSLGLAKGMAMVGMNLPLPQLGAFRIYNDEVHKYDYDSYRVDEIHVGPPIQLPVFIMEGPKLTIYPDNIKVQFVNINLNLPYQKKLLKYNQLNPFTFEASGGAVLTSGNIGLVSKFSVEVDSGIQQFSMVTLPVTLKELEVEIDTLKQDYSIKAGVKLPFIDGLGMTFAIKKGKFDAILLSAEFDVILMTTPVPVTLSDFKLGIEGMSNVAQGSDFNTTLLNSYLSGQLDLEVAKLSALIPIAAKVLPDVSLIKLDDARAKARLNNFSLSFDATLVLFGELELADMELNLWKFNYENFLLDISPEETSGFHAQVSSNIQMKTHNISFTVEGTHSITANTKFVGIQSSGRLDHEIDWFLINSEKQYEGQLLFGVHEPNGKKQLTLLIKGYELMKNKQSGVRLIIKDGSIVPKVKFY